MSFIRKGILSVLLASALATPLPGLAANIDILRAVPLEIGDYPEAKSIPAHFSNADQVLTAINGASTFLVRMEVIRRAYHDLGAPEADKLLAALLERHRQDEKDLGLGFNHGYAQLVFRHNKTGLFFLRKANDRYKDQFSALAYGMAEAEADLNLEKALPEELNVRKMDATFQLGDAVKRDAANHKPGFWPSYMGVIEKLKPIPAYGSFTRRDFSLAYLPYGNSVVPMHGTTTINLPLTDKPATLFSNALTTSCNPETPTDADAAGPAVNTRAANFDGNSALIQFFSTNEPALYRVRVNSSDGRPMLSFRTYAIPNVVEDLDGDGTFEIVARQYKQDPLNPVLVYRYTPCGFELDKKIFDFFH